MIIAIAVLGLLLTIVLGLLFGQMVLLHKRMGDVEDQLLRISTPPNVGGRRVPTMAEIESAKNRIDQHGTAHP